MSPPQVKDDVADIAWFPLERLTPISPQRQALEIIEALSLPLLVLLGERSLRRAVSEYVEHYHAERNHQGKGNVLLFPRDAKIRRDGLFNAASDRVDSCVITIRRRHERVWRLR